MKSLRKLLGHENKFFDLLESSANEALTSVKLLAGLLKTPPEAGALDHFIQTRRKDKRITEEITTELCRTFVTPLEREDIEELSFALYKIPKTAEKFSEKYLLSRQQIEGTDFSGQMRLLEGTARTVAEMVQELRGRKRLEHVKEQRQQLHHFEGEADKLVLAFVKDLYSGRHDPLRVIVTLDLVETMEKIIDRCRDAGNVIFKIVLKYS